MTSDSYIKPYDWCDPRPYHYYIVDFTIYNSYTDEYNTISFYVSSKHTLKWMQSLSIYQLPHRYLSYKVHFKEVEDQCDVVFEHITSRQAWYQVCHNYFLEACATCRWKISYVTKLKKFLHKYFVKFRKVEFELS